MQGFPLSPVPLSLFVTLRDHKANAAGIRGGVLYWHFVDIVWIAVYGIIYAAQL